MTKRITSSFAQRRTFLLALGLVALLVIAAKPSRALAQWTIGTPITTYWDGPTLSNTVAQQAVDGGFNLVWAYSVQDLQTAQAYGLRVIWRGSMDSTTINSIKDNPALYAYFLADEPSAGDFPSLASTAATILALDPNHMCYINLFPTYASTTQLGTTGSSTYPLPYQDYLNQFINTVHPSMLSYDNYPFLTLNSGTYDQADYFANLAMISYTAKQADIPFMNIVQAESFNSITRIPDAGELRFLVNTTLAYGGQGVSYFNYTVLPGGTGGGIQPNPDGSQTQVYEDVSTINPGFVAITKQVQKLNHIGAYHLGDLPPDLGAVDGNTNQKTVGAGAAPQRLPDNSPFQLSPSIQNSIYVLNAPVKGVVMGLWGHDNQVANAIEAYVVNLDYTNSLSTRIMGPEDLSVYDTTTLQWIAQGHPWADVTMQPGGGVLVGITSQVSVPEPASAMILLPGLLLLRRRARAREG